MTPQDIALDVTAGKMYWVEERETGSIQRANLDGTNMEELVSGDGLSDTNDIALDVEAGKIYWIEDGGKAIRRANLDGSNVEDVVTSTMGGLKCIALDTQEEQDLLDRRWSKGNPPGQPGRLRRRAFRDQRNGKS